MDLFYVYEEIDCDDAGSWKVNRNANVKTWTDSTQPIGLRDHLYLRKWTLTFLKPDLFEFFYTMGWGMCVLF